MKESPQPAVSAMHLDAAAEAGVIDARLQRALEVWQPQLPLAVAFSGGADSSALLLACARRWPGRVGAIHVHHGLQEAADDFAQHCAQQAQRWGVPLTQCRVQAQHAPGESPEAAARHARYAALEAAAHAGWSAQGLGPARTVALAQHADDQVETLLLALSRGAGVAGLASMPARWERAGLQWSRPWLEVPGEDLRHWLRSQGETWVEDPTNAQLRYTRNRIRHQLLPALAQTFPSFRTTFARSSAHAAQAAELLSDLAEQDLAQIGRPPVIAQLQQLSHARQANALRHWLLQAHGCTPSTAQLETLLQLVDACRTRGHQIHLKIGRGFVQREGSQLRWYNP